MMAHNYKVRQSDKRLKAQEESVKRIFLQNLGNTIVLLEDSRAVGNCVQGTLSYVQRRLGIAPEDILACAHLIGVRANRLFGNQIDDKRAAFRAFQRETTISI